MEEAEGGEWWEGDGLGRERGGFKDAYWGWEGGKRRSWLVEELIFIDGYSKDIRVGRGEGMISGSNRKIGLPQSITARGIPVGHGGIDAPGPALVCWDKPRYWTEGLPHCIENHSKGIQVDHRVERLSFLVLIQGIILYREP